MYGRRLREQLLPFLIPGHRTRGSGSKWAGKANPCFYLNSGNDHASDCDKVMLESGITSYITNATYVYRRVPFVGQQVTFGNGAIRAPSPPPATTSMGGSRTGGLVGQLEKSDAVTAPSPPPAASSAGRADVGVLQGHSGRGGGIGGGITLPSLSLVAPSTEGGDTGGPVGQLGESDAVTASSPPPATSGRGGETSAFCKVTRAAEGALGGASLFLHYRRLHRRRKEETPAVYVVNRRSGVNRIA